MALQTTYTDARANFATLCDQVTTERDVVIISRRGAEDVALISAAELAGILETAHLLSSPKNAERLLSALRRAKKGSGKLQTIESLRQELDVDAKE